MAHKPLVYFFVVLMFFSGVLAYFNLGRMEDPDYTIRQMVITTNWPGATAVQVEEQVTDRLEKKLQDLEGLAHLESYSMPGQSVITVELKDTTAKSDIAGKWADARNLVQAEKINLPEGIETPQINDHFDAVYGMVYALTAADGYGYPEMKAEAEKLRQVILTLPQTKKVELLGAQTPYLYIDADMNKMQKMGIHAIDIEQMVQAENTVIASGNSSTKEDNLPLRLKDTFTSPRELASLPLAKDGRVLRLGDFSEIHRGYPSQGEAKFFYQGRPAIGLAISMTAGENILGYGDDLSAIMESMGKKLPAGMEIHPIVNQAQSVDEAIFTFVRSLVEALIIIFAVSLFSLGRKAGIVVVLCIPFVLSVVFAIMYLLHIDLQSVSLGGLIIGLGLLVDDAMIVVEMMMVKLEEGWEKKEAVVHAFEVTAFPMLTGTLITCAGFIPVAFATGSASEFCVSLFSVITIALLTSWVVAGTVTPLLGYHFIDSKVVEQKENKLQVFVTRFYKWYSQILKKSIENRKKVLMAAALLFVLACGGLTLLRQEFFPSSARPELIVRLELPTDASLAKTEQVAEKFAALLFDDKDLDTFTYATGMGLPRFVLSFDPAQEKPNLAEFLLIAKNLEARQRLENRVQKLIAKELPKVKVHTKVLATGSSSEYPVMLRVQGPELNRVREIADQVEEQMRKNPDMMNVSQNAGQQALALHVKMDPLRSRMLGVTTQSVAPDIQRVMEGKIISSYQEGNEAIPILLRMTGEFATPIENFQQLPVNLVNGQMVPLNQVADIGFSMEDAFIFRRDRNRAIQVCAEVQNGKTGDDVTQNVYDSLVEYRNSLPPGYRIELAGSLADSNTNTNAFLAPLPIMILIILVLLMLQLQNIVKTGITLLTAPLGIIGVAGGLMLTGRPIGFVVIMGILALCGIIIRNSVILIDQVEKHRAMGESVEKALINASISRLRPIMLAAMAAVLAMIPLTGNTLWGPMAVAMGAGLLVATVLTLLVLPAMYASVYIREDKVGEQP